jgi:hypothetical protein
LDPTQESDGQIRLSSVGLVDPSNSNNPQDSTGVLHNEFLDDFINSTNDEYDALSPTDVFEFAELDEYGQSMLTAYGTLNPGAYNSQPMEDLYTAHQAMFSYYFSLREIAANENLDLEAKIEAIKQFESSFDYSSFTSSEAACLQVTSSIARYSLFYWAPTNEGGLGYFDLIEPIDDNLQGIDWWVVGVDDIWGAAVAGFSTANPFVALGWGGVNSGVGLVRQWVA